MTMANSLEARMPFLDMKVYNIAINTATNQYVKNNQTKVAFREVANEVLPEEWAKRKKLGFPVPVGQWLREKDIYKLVKKELNSDLAARFFNRDVVNKLLEEQLSGVANGRKIYTLYSFIIWYKVYFEEGA